MCSIGARRAASATNPAFLPGGAFRPYPSQPTTQTDEESRRGDACRRPCRRTHGVGLPRRATTRVAPTRQLPAVECQNPTALQMQPACKHQRRSRNPARLRLRPTSARSATVMANDRRDALVASLLDEPASPEIRHGRPQGSPLRVSGPALRPKTLAAPKTWLNCKDGTCSRALVSCPASSCDFSARHVVCGKARSAGNGGSIAKGRNAATGHVARALRERAERDTRGAQRRPTDRRTVRS